jgi:hypothetical protein
MANRDQGVCGLFRSPSEDPQYVGSWHGKAPWFEITDDLPQYAEPPFRFRVARQNVSVHANDLGKYRSTIAAVYAPRD